VLAVQHHQAVDLRAQALLQRQGGLDQLPEGVEADVVPLHHAVRGQGHLQLEQVGGGVWTEDRLEGLVALWKIGSP